MGIEGSIMCTCVFMQYVGAFVDGKAVVLM